VKTGDRKERARYHIGMRALSLSLLCLALAGCNSLTRVGSDGFEASRVSPAQWEEDTSACQIEADSYLAYDARGMEGTRYQKNRAFNAVYGRCMRARGYKPRPYYKNLLPS
jgi:hypothetical protein